MAKEEDLNREVPSVSPTRKSPAVGQDDDGQRDAQGASPTPDPPRPRRPDHDAIAAPVADQELQEFHEVDPEVIFFSCEGQAKTIHLTHLGGGH